MYSMSDGECVVIYFSLAFYFLKFTEKDLAAWHNGGVEKQVLGALEIALVFVPITQTAVRQGRAVRNARRQPRRRKCEAWNDSV